MSDTLTGRHCGDRTLHGPHTWTTPFASMRCGGTVPDDKPDDPTCPHGDPWCRCDGAAHR